MSLAADPLAVSPATGRSEHAGSRPAITGLILAGGQGARMGGPEKPWVRLGDRALIEHAVARLLPQVDTILISTPSQDTRLSSLGLATVADAAEERLGPLAGIAAGLAQASTSWVMVVPCDTPRLPLDLVGLLWQHAQATQPQAVGVSVQGRLHASVCLLSQSLAPVAAAALNAGVRKLRDWLRSIGAVALELSEQPEAFMNINTPEELLAAQTDAEGPRQGRSTPDATPTWHGEAPVLGIAAYSGTGKTTLLEALIPRLKQAGLRVALVKHAHHDFDIDQPGKDSYRLRKAGANPVVVGSARRIASIIELPLAEAIEQAPPPRLATLLARIDPSSVDLILIEGYKHSQLPRLILRRGDSAQTGLALDAPGVLALVSDTPSETVGLPCLDINDSAALAAFILSWREQQLRARLNNPAPGCDHDPDAQEVTTAVARIEAALAPVPGCETLPLRLALGRVTVAAVTAHAPVPGFDNAAVDGYACRADDATLHAELKLIGQSLAGRPAEQALAPGTCMRITTGASLPEGTDCVLMQEDVERLADGIRLQRAGKLNQHIRRAGEDIAAGSEVLPAGRRLSTADIGVLASLGQSEIRVRRRLRVAILSTGDELKPLGQPLAAGDIYDSNRYSLAALLQEWPVEILDYGRAADDRAALKDRLREAAAAADLLITSGGVSVGDADLIKPLCAELGEILFWKVAIKPGRPLVFARVGTTPVLGLPGNPVAVQVCFRQFVVPALARLMDMQRPVPWRLQAICRSPLRKVPGRMEFQRGYLEAGPAGLEVWVCGDQGSHRLSSVSAANCYIVLSTELGPVPPGSLVTVELL